MFVCVCVCLCVCVWYALAPSLYFAHSPTHNTLPELRALDEEVQEQALRLASGQAFILTTRVAKGPSQTGTFKTRTGSEHVGARMPRAAHTNLIGLHFACRNAFLAWMIEALYRKT